jgi:murein DD-endopeptidase MepM/ murein hydrolase activator NlpD
MAASWLVGSLHPAPKLVTDLLRNEGAAFADTLQFCPTMQVTNRPVTDGAGRVLFYQKFTHVRGVKLATNPAQGACLSSGFGARNGREHQGVDYSARGGPILAAGDGAVIERKYLPNYGNVVLIDHGNGVYTRYAHLARSDPGLKSLH